MKIKIGQVYKVVDVLDGNPCMKCNPCTKLRLMEIGFICGEYIQVIKHQGGIYLTGIMNKNGIHCQTIALRDNELDRLSLEEVELV